MTEITVPSMGLVVLVGVSGSGKSTFAARHFGPFETVSSDYCRGLVSNDTTDQSSTGDAFDLLHTIVGTRLRRGLLTVVDATNVQVEARRALVKLARDHDVLVDAIVLDVSPSVAIARNDERPDRTFGGHVVTRQHRDLKRSMRGLRKEGFRRVHVLRPETLDDVTITREKPWNDLTERQGPFDIIGDVHGCASELRTLLTDLGWVLEFDDEGRAVGAAHPQQRTAVFVGDLVDRGPDTPGVLRLVMGMVSAGVALSVSGNHEAKLVRALRGARVTVSHGLAESLAQLAAEPDEFQAAALAFIDGLISHYVLDGGSLVVAHAGLKESYHGRSSGRVRSFALYGDTTGETDEYGLPVRLPWALEYRGKAAVVYGHTPVLEAEWINNTICLDTGVVFGGKLTALRLPEREIVQVEAEQQWYAPVRPLAPVTVEREPMALRADDVLGNRWLTSERAGRVKIPDENAAAALEIMSRFAIDPRWLVHLPPTMAPAPASQAEGFLEYPDMAFDAYAERGLTEVVCEEKHMGSRAVVVVARDADVAARRFGIDDGSTGAVFTRTGRSFLPDVEPFLDRVRASSSALFSELDTDWLALDCELLPWSAKAEDLIRTQYASVGAAGAAALPEVVSVLDAAAARGLDVSELRERAALRSSNLDAFRRVYGAYCWPTQGLAGLELAPFQVLAFEGEVAALTRGNRWHLEAVGRLQGDWLRRTQHRVVDLADAGSRAEATQWWLDLTGAGGEGMVVKPTLPVDEWPDQTQPGLKVRGREYLRLIYGPDYTSSLDVLRSRHLGKKQHLALREFGLGLDALEGFVKDEPLWRVHQRVFAILALESEPVDPRL